jgi:cobalt transporter subunit CbtB
MQMQSHNLGVQAPTAPIATTRSEAVVAAVLAAGLGMFVLWGVGFSQIPALHNAAHDTRHSIAFPCH